MCLLMLLTACAIAPVPLTDSRVKMIAERDRQKIFEDQESLDVPLTLERAMAMALK